MSKPDDDTFEMGENGERLVEEVIRGYGWYVNPTRKYCDDEGTEAAPMMEGDDGKLVLPDIYAARSGRREYIEVKTKSSYVEYRKKGGEPQHGIDERLWQEYVDVQTQTGDNVWLFIYEKDIGQLLRQKFEELPVDHRHNGNGYSEPMVYFSRSLFDIVPISSEILPSYFFGQDSLPSTELHKKVDEFELFPTDGDGEGIDEGQTGLDNFKGEDDEQ